MSGVCFQQMLKLITGIDRYCRSEPYVVKIPKNILLVVLKPLMIIVQVDYFTRCKMMISIILLFLLHSLINILLEDEFFLHQLFCYHERQVNA